MNLDLDGNTDANGRPMDWFTSLDPETSVPNDTNYVASSSSWFNPAGIAQNWLITPPLNICDTDVVINWWSAPLQGPAFSDGYVVLVSTTGTSTGDFTDTIFIHSESIGGGAAQTAGNSHSNYNLGQGVLQEWQRALSQYVGQSIYIAFVHNSNDDNMLLLDNIFVGDTFMFDIGVDKGTSGTIYSQIPQFQLTAPGLFDFSARLKNRGNHQIIHPGRVTNRVLDPNGLSIYSDQQGFNWFPGGIYQYTETANAFSNVTQPVPLGEYKVIYDAEYWSPVPPYMYVVDSNTTNNSDTASFIASDTIYARDGSLVTGSLSIGFGASGEFAQMFAMFS